MAQNGSLDHAVCVMVGLQKREVYKGNMRAENLGNSKALGKQLSPRKISVTCLSLCAFEVYRLFQNVILSSGP